VKHGHYPGVSSLPARSRLTLAYSKLTPCLAGGKPFCLAGRLPSSTPWGTTQLPNNQPEAGARGPRQKKPSWAKGHLNVFPRHLASVGVHDLAKERG
jgi:hypothetical protein